EGSTAASGIGCHVMASWMNRQTVGYAQMGGEGVPHIAASMFTGGKHMFQNIGEGTWYHSGSLAIRQAVAAGANITYKILYNDAVAMTGGQPVDGPISVAGIAQTCRAEGVERIALISDDIGKFDHREFPAGTSFHDRRMLDPVQRELRDCPGVTVLIYEQTCASEKRRRRKRGQQADPQEFAYINDLVCEGCGDCSVESNCLSVEPKDTPLGRKRKINLNACNKDFSCLNGFCPSFVTVTGATRRKPDLMPDLAALEFDLPAPAPPPLSRPFNLLVTGVGGTGVITVGALISMAAHLEGLGASVLDFTGFAQKFGTVLSYIRLGKTPRAVNQVRIDQGSADAVIGCDIVVSSAPQASTHYGPETRVALNRAEMPTGDLVLHRDASLHATERETAIAQVVGAERVTGFDANHLAETLLGDAVFANVMMLGFAWQSGMVPVSDAALKQALELNGVAVQKNLLAFAIGRCVSAAPDRLPKRPVPKAQKEALDQMIARRAKFLEGYQNAAYSARYTSRISRLRAACPDADNRFVRAAARNLFRFMAYKDEYEVARLMTAPELSRNLQDEFNEGFGLRYHLAPPLLSWRKDARGRPSKRAFGPWLRPVLVALARARSLRTSVCNPFGYHTEARMHRDLLRWYEDLLDRIEEIHSAATADTCMRAVSAADEIRGFGPVRADAAKTTRTRVDAILQTSATA
ncbi:MAG: indolepyruvate ferredoxin oxidoreductase family protein, partial [Pseudomonadota bacterium]